MSSVRRVGGHDPAGGFSCVELVIVLALISIVSSMALPATADSRDAARARAAAGFIAARCHLARQRAVAASHAVALVFDRTGADWTFRVCEDGNGNGLRRAEIPAVDHCVDGPYDLAAMFPHVAIAVDASLPGPEGDPGSADPVRFGASDIATFAPAGTGTAGSLFLRSAHGRQFAVRISNVTGRTRLLRYDTGTRQWIAG
jgi:type II secretory pathway pseudopilin PulG